MDNSTMLGLALSEETMQVLVAEATEENAAQMKNAPELAALEASDVACATHLPTTEYITEAPACQVSASPIVGRGQPNVTLEEIEITIADAARKRIESAHREAEDTHSRIEREHAARERALQAMNERVSEIQAALDRLGGERSSMECRARAFLGGGKLEATLDQIHLAFNIRKLELDDALATAKTDVLDAKTEIEAANVSDALELQLAEQEVERLESAAPEVAHALQRAEAVSQLIASARQALQDGMLRDAAALVEQAKKEKTDAYASPITRAQGVAEDPSTAIDELERALADAQKTQIARDLIARLNAIHERPGALKRIKQFMDQAATSGVADQVASAAAHAQQLARHAANERFAQARPIADHLVAEGYVPIIGDGRIESWKRTSHNGKSASWSNDSHWKLDRILLWQPNGEWLTEKPHVSITRKELTPSVKRSRWYRTWASNRDAVATRSAASDPIN